MTLEGGSFSALMGALGGAFVTFFFSILKMQMDGYSSQYKEMCELIVECADLSAEYWLTDAKNHPDSDIANKNHNQRKLIEYKLQSYITRILFLDSVLKDAIPFENREKIGQEMLVFIDACTGRDFKSREGDVRPDAAELVQISAGNLVCEIQAGLQRKLDFWYIIKSVFLSRERILS